MLKVVHILFNLRLGGTETMLLDIMSHQVEQGVEVVFVLINKEHDQKLLSYIHPKIKVVYINRPDGSKNPWWAVKLNSVLLKLSPDVIHFHNVKALGLVFKRKNIKHVFTAHCIGISSPLLKRADCVCAISKAVKEDLQKRYDITPIVIYNGINVSNISTRSVHEKSRIFKIVQVGRVEHQIKGQDILINAVALLRDQGIKNISVDIIGAGKSENYLKEMVFNLDLKANVNFIGAKSRVEIYKTLCLYDLLVQPSRDEGFGLTLAEGMAAKIPVLLSSLPGPMEVVAEGKYGTIFKSDDIADCAKKIHDIIVKHDKYRSIAENEAFNYLKLNYDIAMTSRRYLEVYSRDF